MKQLSSSALAKHVPTIDDAKAVAEEIVAKVPSVDAIFLCGSVARGDAGPWSDIDLVVIGSNPDLVPADFAKFSRSSPTHISVVYYTTPDFHALLREGILFLTHLQREGICLFDRDGIRQALADMSIPSEKIAEQINAQTERLTVYLDPRRFNNNFLFCLSHLYSIGKGIVMLGLANRGLLEFNREAAFDRFAKLNPDLAPEIQKVAELRPFYRLVAGREPEPLPFPYTSAGRELQNVTSAIQTLARRAAQP